MNKVSQSLIKGIFEYIDGKECGLVLKEKYLLKNYQPATDSQLLGQYFEFITTGALPKGGVAPEPVLSYKGTSRETMSAPYLRVHESKEVYTKIFEEFGIEVLKVGYTLEDDEISGVIDIYAKWNNELIFIDLKYSGLIDDKWSDFGWHEDFLHNKRGLMIQGVHYKELARRILGIEDIPFYYFVFSNKNPLDVKIFRQDVSELKRSEHLEAITYSKKFWDSLVANDSFEAKPEFKKCTECYIRHKCDKYATTPTIYEINY
jgi:hypothetical protein